jgi:Lrp/AsnC family leucine-responsive transcriptional regulator
MAETDNLSRPSTVEIAALDDVDREILRELMRNARVSFRELGERVALSANATAERVRRLRERGVIVGYRAVLNPSAVGRRLVALIDVRLSGPAASEPFEKLIEGLDAITDAAHVTGRFDYQLRVVCADPAELDQIIRTLKTKGGVVETDTRIALRIVLRRSAGVG